MIILPVLVQHWFPGSPVRILSIHSSSRDLLNLNPERIAPERSGPDIQKKLCGTASLTMFCQAMLAQVLLVFSLQVVLLLLLPLCWVIVLHADWLFGQRVTAVPKVQKGDLPVRALPSVVAEIL